MVSESTKEKSYCKNPFVEEYKWIGLSDMTDDRYLM